MQTTETVTREIVSLIFVTLFDNHVLDQTLGVKKLQKYKNDPLNTGQRLCED